MLTVESIRASHAGSYYTEPQSGTFRTEWKAKGSDSLSLNGSVDVEVFRRLLDGRAWFKLREHFCFDTMAYNHCQTCLLRFWGSMKMLPWYPESWTMPVQVSMQG